MTLKTSFSKRLLFNAKERLWSFALGTLMLFFMLPVAATVLATQENNYRYNTTLSEEMMEYFHNQEIAAEYVSLAGRFNMFYVFIFMAIAIVLAMSGFAYLYNHKQVDFYHELPVTRKEIFVTNYIVGIGFFVIPYAVMLFASLAIVQVKTGGLVNVLSVLQGFIYHVVMFMNIYSLVVLAIILTGQMVVGFLGSLVLGLITSVIVGSVYLMADIFLLTWIAEPEKVWTIIGRVSPIANYVHGATQVNWVINLGIAAVEAVLFTVLAVRLYKIRPLEAAGRAMAFKATEPVIKLLICYSAAIFGGAFFFSIMRSNAWGLFGLVCALLITGCVVEIIYRGDFRKLFGNFKIVVLSGICALTVVTFFKADLMGFDSYFPKNNELEKIAFQTYEICPETRWSYYAEPILEEDAHGNALVYFVNKDSLEIADIFTPANQEAVLVLAEDGLKNTADLRKSKYSTNLSANKWIDEQADIESYTQATFAYKLKNGKKKYRKMYVNTTVHYADVKRIYDDLEYKKALYPMLTLDKDDIAGANYKELESTLKHVEMPDTGMKSKLFETYCLELMNLKAADMEVSEPIASIQFKTNEMQQMIDEIREVKGDYTPFNNYFYYPIYPQFKDTIALLKECGIEAGASFAPEVIDRIELRYWPDRDAAYEMDKLYAAVPEEDMGLTLAVDAEDGFTNGYKELIVDDKEKIKEIMDAAYVGEIGIANPFAKRYTGLVIDVYAQRPDGESLDQGTYAGTTSFTIALDADRIPEFVKDYFGLNEEKIQRSVEKMF